MCRGNLEFCKKDTRKAVKAISSEDPGLVETELEELKSMIKMLVSPDGEFSHSTEGGPTNPEDGSAEVNALGGYNQNRYNNYNSGYNGWRNQPSLRDQVQTLTQHLSAHVTKTESSINNLEKQVGQLTQDVAKLVQQKVNVSAIHLRSGKKLLGSSEAEHLIDNTCLSITEAQAVLDAQHAKEKLALERQKKRTSAIPTEAKDDEQGQEKAKQSSSAESDARAQSQLSPTTLERPSERAIAKALEAETSEHQPEEEEYEDCGDFALRQENYVRPKFPPFYSEKPPTPFPDALKDNRRPVNDKDL